MYTKLNTSEFYGENVVPTLPSILSVFMSHCFEIKYHRPLLFCQKLNDDVEFLPLKTDRYSYCCNKISLLISIHVCVYTYVHTCIHTDRTLSLELIFLSFRGKKKKRLKAIFVV